MTDPELMSIGAFAERAGMTASALRFYDDAGLLRPDRVDPVTGYRRYSEAQVARADRLRRLREIGMPLSVIGTFFAADSDEAVRLIDEQVAKVTAQAAEVRRAAARLKASLDPDRRHPICALAGPVLAEAVDQVMAATIHHPDMPVLNGVRLEADGESVALTATDRYRLATRTLVPVGRPSDSWAGTLDGDDLLAMSARMRRSTTVTIEAGERSVGFQLTDGTVLPCRLRTETFPDHRLMLDALPSVTHRVTVGKHQVVRVLEQRAPELVGVRVAGNRPSLLIGDDDVALDGTATGSDVTVWFDLTTLYPAVGHAIGSDVLLDLRGPEQPATVRSADDGDLTTLVMPRRAPERTKS